MKNLLKRSISVIISLVLILSMFSILPFTVSAEETEAGQPLGNRDENGLVQAAAAYNIATSCDIDITTTHTGEEDAASLFDNDQSTANHVASLAITLPTIDTSLPSGVTAQDNNLNTNPRWQLDSVKLLFKSESGTVEKDYYSKTVQVTFDNEQPENVLKYKGYTKTFDESNNPSTFTIALSENSNEAEVAEIRVYVKPLTDYVWALDNVVVNSLYKSNEIEWHFTSGNPKPFTILRKPINGDSDSYEQIATNETIKMLTTNSQRFYSYVDELDETELDKEYIYVIVYENSTTDRRLCALIYALEDQNTVSLRKNALVALDFGAYGKHFTESGSYTMNFTTDRQTYRIPFQLQTKGSFMAMTSLSETAAGNTLLLEFGTTSGTGNSYLERQNSTHMRYHLGNVGYYSDRVIMPGEAVGYGIAVNGSSFVLKDGVSTVSSNRGTNVTNARLLTASTSHVNFNGETGDVLYSIIASDEFYDIDNSTNNYFNTIEDSNQMLISLASDVTEAESHITHEGGMYTKNSLARYQEVVDAAKALISENEFGRATDEDCEFMKTLLETAYNYLDKAQIFTVKVEADGSLNLMSFEESPVSLEVAEESEVHCTGCDGVTAYFEAGTDDTVSVIVSAVPMTPGMTAKWYIKAEDGTLTPVPDGQITQVSPDDTDKFKISGLGENTVLVVSYDGYNTESNIQQDDMTYADGSHSTLKMADDYTDEYNENGYSNHRATAGSNYISPSGEPGFAFDGDITTNWYKSGTITGTGSEINIETGFQTAHLMAAVGYVPAKDNIPNANNSWANKDTAEARITRYRIDVSNTRDFAQYITVVENGTLSVSDEDYENQKEQMLWFDSPISAKYVRIAILETSGNHLAVAEFRVYDYIGEEVRFDVDFDYKDENGESIKADDLPPVDIGFYVPKNVLLKKDVEDVTENTEITAEDVQKEFFRNSYDSLIDSMQYNYTISDDSEITQQADGTWICPIVRSVAKYSLTYTLPGAGESQTITDVPYGQLFTTDDSADATEENLVTAAGVTYWTDNDTDEIICSDPYFSLVSSRNMFVTAHTDAMDTTPSAYIYTPVVSRAYIDASTVGWKIELAVKLNNIMRYTSSVTENHGMVLIDEVEEYGVVIDKNKTENRDSEAIKALLADETDDASQDLTVNKAYVKGDSSKNFRPNNKGRYVHTLATTDESAKNTLNGTKVYSYVKVSGEYYVSNGEELVFPILSH